ncbi:hypothetical protein ES708_14686 [subsurface metagenome]
MSASSFGSLVTSTLGGFPLKSVILVGGLGLFSIKPVNLPGVQLQLHHFSNASVAKRLLFLVLKVIV